MTGWRRPVLLAVALALVPTPGWAQTCFRGAPAPRCRQFVVLEMDAARAAGAVVRDPYVFSWAAGGMLNVGPRSALGAALLVAADDDGHRIGVQGRFRRWLHGRTALDLTPAIFLGGHRNGGTGPGGAVLGIAVTHGDLVGVTLGYQLADNAGRLYAGVRFGSWMVPVGMAGLVAAVGATYD
jgi:hypothetical protein